MKINEVILHGECMVFPSEIPKTAKKMKAKDGFVIVAPSENTGNDHVVDVMDGDVFFEDKGRLYLNSKTGTNIRCVHADRHDKIKIPAGSYEFGSQEEYDPFTARMGRVRD